MKSQPIIVIKKKSGHGGHHGGAWKVAYADFVTAMMSLFIVLWLMGSSEKVKRAVAGYFNDPKGTATLLGTTMSGTGETIVAPSNDLQKLKEKIEQQIQARKDLEKLSKQIEITITPEGLRIELIEGREGTFYQSGSARLSPSGQELLALLAGELKTLPNKLLIEGHTDSVQYSTDNSYSNWELSADRANAARRLMQQDGVRADQVTQVRGYADQLLRVKSNPTDPSNRRISILVKNENGAPPKIDQSGIDQSRVDQGKAIASSSPPASEHDALKAAQSDTKPQPVAASSAAAATAPAKPGMLDKIKRLLPGSRK